MPHALANDADYLARFQREAQTLAALNHPNIATIYGLEENAIVMELVEGATLQGPLPLSEALPLAKQIAEALEAAHDKGIIHRDLKPGNVKVTPEGVVKVLDFGLAKAVNERPVVVGPDSPTLTLRATEAGLILGTAGYMSPEQAAGKTVDRRADIWSFGVVFYELLTGKRMFDGETVTHKLADVVRAPIDLSMIEDAQIRHLIGRCLDRNLKTRLAHIGEARIALETYAPEKSAPPAKAGWWPWAAGALALGLVATGIGWYTTATRPAPTRAMLRLHLDLPPETPLMAATNDISGRGNTLALSPDGTRLAITMRGADGKIRIHTRLQHQEGFTAVAGAENATFPFFSPDGAWIGFLDGGNLKKVAVEGGAAATIGGSSNNAGASWGNDGQIVHASRGALFRISANGGDSAPLTERKPGEGHRWPHVLPGSKAVLFTAFSSSTDSDGANVEAVSVVNKERKVIVRGGHSARYVPAAGGSGHVIYQHDSTLFAAPFDPDKLTALGPPAPILQDVASGLNSGGHFTTAKNGVFAYLDGKAAQASDLLYWVDAAGALSPLHAERHFYENVRLAPGGKKLALQIRGATGSDIWVKDLERDTLTRVSYSPGWNRLPFWTPDGKSILFQSLGATASRLYAVRADGSSEPKLVPGGETAGTPWSISPDGKRLAVVQNTKDRLGDIFTLPIEADSTPGGPGFRLGKAELFASTPFYERTPMFSPDGRWLAFPSEESGTREIYVRPFPGPGAKVQISAGGGHYPQWSADGRGLFYAAEGQIMAVRYTVKSGEFVAEKPRVWKTARLAASESVGYRYDVAPDGKRLAGVFVAGDDDKPPTRLTFLLNFGDELRRKAPVSK
ncbi:MAG: serine/threonine-protein kinase [Acidobacteria bacterium]|nr:serine/threonine-protein kinase [Acidobacteriota bacterium]